MKGKGSWQKCQCSLHYVAVNLGKTRLFALVDLGLKQTFEGLGGGTGLGLGASGGFLLKADFISSFNLLLSSFNSIILPLSTSMRFFCSFSASCSFFIPLS